MQLYIWKFTGEDKIRVFAMTRLVMGNKPSANCAQIALRETAFIEEEPPAAAVTALTEDSYVDNTFTVAPDNVTIEKTEMALQGEKFEMWRHLCDEGF